MALTDYVIMPGEDYKAACDAVREKTGKEEDIKSGDLAAEIREIAETIVDANLQVKEVTPSTQRQTLVPDEGYDGFSRVEVGKVYLTPLTVTPNVETMTYMSDGVSTSGPSPLCGYSEVTVEGMKLQEKTISPSTESQDVVPDEGYDGLKKVTVDGVLLESIIITPTVSEQTLYPTEYPGSGIRYMGFSKVTVKSVPGQPAKVKIKKTGSRTVSFTTAGSSKVAITTTEKELTMNTGESLVIMATVSATSTQSTPSFSVSCTGASSKVCVNSVTTNASNVRIYTYCWFVTITDDEASITVNTN